MNEPQGFHFFLILLGGVATMLRLVDRTKSTVPYPVLLAAGGVIVGLIPGLRLPQVSSELISDFARGRAAIWERICVRRQ